MQKSENTAWAVYAMRRRMRGPRSYAAGMRRERAAAYPAPADSIGRCLVMLVDLYEWTDGADVGALVRGRP
jgi:hypothetical protein